MVPVALARGVKNLPCLRGALERSKKETGWEGNESAGDFFAAESLRRFWQWSCLALRRHFAKLEATTNPRQRASLPRRIKLRTKRKINPPTRRSPSCTSR